MNVNLLWLLIVGLNIRIVFSFKTIRKTEIYILNLKNDSNTTGYHPKKQLTCLGDLQLCNEYAPSTVTCLPNKYETSGFRCKSKFPSFIAFGKERNISCEEADQKINDDDLIEDSCSFSYSLEIRTKRLARTQYLYFPLNQMTSSYRKKSRPVLVCQDREDKLCHIDQVIEHTVRCRLVKDAEFKCNFEIYKEFIKAEKLSIECEEPPNKNFEDEYLIGTCGMNYSLELVTMRLSSIEQLNFKINEMTLGSKPTEQLHCLGPQSLCVSHRMIEVVCDKTQFNTLIFWNCSSRDNNELPDYVEFDLEDVHCEKATNKTYEDEIKMSSCRLDYTLRLKSIRLNDITQLVFQRYRWTNSAKNSLDELKTQLTCVNDTFLCARYAPDQVTCVNRNSNAHKESKWICDAKMNEKYEFNTLDILCEEIEDGKENSYLYGSCALRYSLVGKKEKLTPGWIILIVILSVFVLLTLSACFVQLCKNRCLSSAYIDQPVQTPIITMNPHSNDDLPPSYESLVMNQKSTSFIEDHSMKI